MAIGFVLICTTPTHEHNVYNELSKLPEIIELHPLFGEYDLIAKIEADNSDLLATIIIDKIRSIKGIAFTITFIGTRF
jgi:DNA-binding Lrp family transcriptional regulator